MKNIKSYEKIVEELRIKSGENAKSTAMQIIADLELSNLSNEKKKRLEELIILNFETVRQNELAVLKEITEESENLLNSIISLHPDLLWLKDKNGVYLHCNLRFEQFFGHPQESIIGKTDYDFVNKDLADFFRKNDEEAIAKGKPTVNEEEITFANDGHIEILETIKTPIYKKDGQVFGVLGIGRNITMRKNTEEALRASEERFRNILQDVNSVAVQGYSTDGTTLYWNKGSELLYGFTANEAIGANMLDLIIPTEMRDSLIEGMKWMAESGRPIPSSELSLLRKDGTSVSVYSNHTIVQIPGHAKEFYCLDIDISERKRAEEKLRESEERFKSLHNASFGGICIHDKGVILECNQGLAEMTGYTHTELIGMDGLLLIAPITRDYVLANIISGYEKAYESIGMRKNGELFPMRLEARNVPYKGKIVRTVEFRDISESKQIDAMFQDIIDKNPLSIQIVDSNGITIKTNPAHTALFGIAPPPGFSIFEELQRIGFADLILRAKNGEIVYFPDTYFNVHNIFSHFPDKPVWVKSVLFPLKNSSADPEQYVLMHEDITERKVAEEALRKSESIKNKMVSNIGDVIVIIDENGLIQYKSPNIETLFGWKPEELIGKDTWENVHPDDCEAGQRFIESIVAEPNSSRTTELRYRRKDGNYVWIEINVLNLFHDKDIHGLLGNYHDISERKLTEYELISAKVKAEESDKLKTAFLQNMSHEIRTPLNGILGFSNLLNEGNLNDDDIKEYTGLISQSGRRLLEIINNLLDISKIETGQMKIQDNTFSLNSMIAELYSFFSPFAEEKNIELRYSPSPENDIYHIVTDETKLSQILTNLINNAIKFTSEGSIEFGYEIINVPSENSLIQFYVKDSGIGIAPELHDKIFERFVQVDLQLTRGYEGAGLGLAICKGLVEMLGGKIWLTGELNKGTTFFFTIPFIHELAESKHSEEIIHDTYIGKKITILIAEDDYASYIFLSKVLNEDRFILVHAETGKQAVEFVKKSPDINLVLMDIRMPQMDGIEATKQIKAIRPELPIIAQTAFAFREEKEKILAIGCNDYLAKPIDKDVLLKFINKYIG